MILYDNDEYYKEFRDNVYDLLSDADDLGWDKANQIIDLFLEAPKVNVDDNFRKTGHWIPRKFGLSTFYICPYCNEEIIVGGPCNFCPNCGVIMNKEIRNEL